MEPTEASSFLSAWTCRILGPPVMVSVSYRSERSIVIADVKDVSKKLNDYRTILADYLGHSAWFLGPNGLPVVSTFSSGGLQNTDWSGKALPSSDQSAMC